MRWACIVTLFIAAAAGCGGNPSSTAGKSDAPNLAAAGDVPQLVVISDQKRVYECPKCGMTFDRAGTCTMNCGELVEMSVDYICPADNGAVEKAGKCPRCPMDARIVKTQVAIATELDSATGRTQ